MLLIYAIVMLLVMTNAALALDSGYEKWAVSLAIAVLVMAWNVTVFM